MQTIDIQHGSKWGNKFYTSFSYTRCSVQIEWSEQLRLVTSLWLGAVCRRVQIRLCTEQRV